MTAFGRARVTVSSRRGVVAAAHPLAAQAGARILREGGNAFDAAAATAAALGVVEPFMSGLAGMGVATCYSADDNSVTALDFVARNPLALDIEGMSSRADLQPGARSVGAPSNLAGWAALIGRYGKRSLAEILAPAIELARDGVPLTQFSANEIVVTAPVMQAKGAELYALWLRTYGIDGRLPTTGDVLKQEALARAFEAIATDGIGHLYGGPLGRALVALVAAHGGALQLADLEAVAPVWQTPTTARYRDLLVHVPPVPAEAFQYLLTLRLLDGVDLGAFEHNGPDHIDTVLRAIRLAAGIRIAHNLATPDEVRQLLSEESLAPFRERLRDGRPVQGPTEQYVAPVPGPAQHTTSLSIADRDGNVCCLTQSLGSVFGSGVVLADHGVCLNNFLTFGDLHPNGTKRLVAGGPLALPIAPSIATLGDKAVLALGTPGSYGIPQHQTQVLVRHKDYGFGLQEAIEQPRARLTDGRQVMMESRFGPQLITEMTRRGHEVETGPAWTRRVGGMQGIAIDPVRHTFAGGADPRRDGYVAAP